MKVRSEWLAMATGSLVAFALVAGEPVKSDPCIVYANPASSLHWKTAFSETLPVSIDWPEGAVSAVLTVSAADKVLDTVELNDTSVSEYDYTVTRPAATDDEQVLTLALAFAGEDTAVIEERTARVGLVMGVGGNGVPVVAGGEAAPKWAKRKTRTGTVVLPVPEGATSLAVDGGDAIPLPDAPGWYVWSGLETRTYDLVLTVGETEWTANPDIRIPGGLLLLLR